MKEIAILNEQMMEFSCRWMSLDVAGTFFFIFWASFAPQHTATLRLLRDSTRQHETYEESGRDAVLSVLSVLLYFYCLINV
jgi:hypothetical protein